MGLKNILVIIEDAYRTREAPYHQNEAVCCEVGKAVLKASTMIERLKTGRKYAPIFNHVNAAQFVDQVDQTKQRVYLWARNCLRSIRKLDDKDLEIAERLIREEREYRGSR